MNKRQLFLGLGTMLVAVTGYLAGRANAKTVNPLLYYKTIGTFGTCKPILNSSSGFTTGTFAGNISFKTTGGGSIVSFIALYKNSDCSTALPDSHHLAVK